MTNLFGEATYVEDKDTKDLTQYKAFLKSIPEGKRAIINVPTGVVNPKTGRGKSEKADEKAFRDAALEEGQSVRVEHRHLADGMTQLTLKVVPKREFSEFQTAAREMAMADRLVKLYTNKVADLKSKNEDTKEAEENLAKWTADLKEKKATFDKVSASRNGGTTQTPPAPPAKAQAPKAPAPAGK